MRRAAAPAPQPCRACRDSAVVPGAGLRTPAAARRPAPAAGAHKVHGLPAVQVQPCSSAHRHHGLLVQQYSSAHSLLPARQCRTSAYDNSALYSNEDTFAERPYWDRRYEREPAAFEWYKGYDSALRPLVVKYLPRELPLLQLGMGTSTVHWDMVQDGYRSILSVDYSPVAVEAQRAAYAHVPQLRFEVADVRNMQCLVQDGAMAGVLDKGTLDALLCGEDDVGDAARMLSEVCRVLEPGGVYLHITHAPPSSRLRYLATTANAWASIEVWEVGQRGATHGPHAVPFVLPDSAVPLPSAAALPAAKEVFSHWVYCCRKRLEVCGLRHVE